MQNLTETFQYKQTQNICVALLKPNTKIKKNE